MRDIFRWMLLCGIGAMVPELVTGCSSSVPGQCERSFRVRMAMHGQVPTEEATKVVCDPGTSMQQYVKTTRQVVEGDPSVTQAPDPKSKDFGNTLAGSMQRVMTVSGGAAVVVGGTKVVKSINLEELNRVDIAGARALGCNGPGCTDQTFISGTGTATGTGPNGPVIYRTVTGVCIGPGCNTEYSSTVGSDRSGVVRVGPGDNDPNVQVFRPGRAPVDPAAQQASQKAASEAAQRNIRVYIDRRSLN